MNPRQPEMARIAASLRLTGDLLEAHGVRTLAAVEAWAKGPASPPLDPTERGTPPDPDNGIAPDPDRDTHARLLRILRALDACAYEVRLLVHRANPHLTLLPVVLETPDEIAAAGWCISCHRDTKDDGSHWCEPIAERPDGRRRYDRFCNWCGEFQARRATLETTVIEPLLERMSGRARKTARRRWKQADRRLPPLELVQARHAGKRVTQAMVDEALARLIDTPEPKGNAA